MQTHSTARVGAVRILAKDGTNLLDNPTHFPSSREVERRLAEEQQADADWLADYDAATKQEGWR